MQHMQKENRRKPSVFAGFVAGAEGLVSPAGSGAGRSPVGAPSTDRSGSRDRRWTQPTGLQVPTTRTAGEPAGAPCCQDVPPNDKKQRHCKSSSAIFWQGQKDLVSPAGSGAAPRWGAPSTDRGGSRDRFAAERHWRSLTPRHAGFWSGCGRTQSGAGKGRCCLVPAASPREGGAGLVLRAIFGEGLCIDYHFFLRKKSTSARRMAKLTRITAG